MPGLSVALGDAGAVEGAAASALDATEVFDHYTADRVDLAPLESAPGSSDGTASPVQDDVIVGRTSYEGYPFRRVDTEHGTILLEGRLYDVEDVDAHLKRVASRIATDDVDGLREWVGARDGDFLIALVGADVTLLTDAFARLPTYYATIDGTVVCSRELAFVREFARRRESARSLDRLAVGQLLAFGYPLGTRTLLEGVRVVPPGSLVRLRREAGDPDDGIGAGGRDDGTGSTFRNDRSTASSGDATGGSSTTDAAHAEIESVYEHDFEECEHANRSVTENADELVERITAASRRRSDPERPTVLSLSGGLDSRTVAAAYAADGTPATAATFQRAGNGNSAEVAAAGAAAAHLDLDWTVYTVDSSPERRETLLRTKQGMNYLGMAFVLDFFEQLRDHHGTSTYVTGDGGDKLLVGLEPTRSIDSRSALVDHVIDANGRMPLSDAAAIANVDADAIRASVADRIDSYPESDLDRAYVHFLFRERGYNFLVQGEDRNRYYAWSVSPFYALPVFEYAMNCPDEQKDYRRLQSAILERLDPGLVDLPYPNYGAPISTRRYRAKQFVYDTLERFPSVRERVVDLVTNDDGDASSIVAAIRADIPRIGAAGLAPEATAAVLARQGQYSTGQLATLETATRFARSVAGTDAPAGLECDGTPTNRADPIGSDSARTDRDASGARIDDESDGIGDVGGGNTSARVER